MLISDVDAKAIFAALYKFKPLSVVTDFFDDYTTLMNTRCGNNESFKIFESRFSAAVSCYCARGDSIALPEAIKAFLLLTNANVSEIQRVPLLSAASPKAAVIVSVDGTVTSNDQILKLVEYESVASVIRQCDSKGAPAVGSSNNRSTFENTFSGNNVNAVFNNRFQQPVVPELLSSVWLAEAQNVP